MRVASLEDIQEGRPFLVTLEDYDIALYKVKDSFFATDDLCSHAEASLCEGEQRGFTIECPRHGGSFDIRSGKATHFPAFSPIQTYPVKVEDGALFIELDDDD
ncbi:MAG: non-heme iron oxygenase ferredoxin subunit [Firmicutes bacterium]|nr:non-heme iron oxygenase ferredoxin subunit [Bacillota bacterium]